MRKLIALLFAGLSLLPLTGTRAEVVGAPVIGAKEPELHDIAEGWSAKMQVIGQPVFNEQREWIGNIDDLVIVPGKPTSYGIVNISFFLKVPKRLIAVPVSQLIWEEGKLVLPGATLDALKATPAFEFVRR